MAPTERRRVEGVFGGHNRGCNGVQHQQSHNNSSVIHHHPRLAAIFKHLLRLPWLRRAFGVRVIAARGRRVREFIISVYDWPFFLPTVLHRRQRLAVAFDRTEMFVAEEQFPPEGLRQRSGHLKAF